MYGNLNVEYKVEYIGTYDIHFLIVINSKELVTFISVLNNGLSREIYTYDQYILVRSGVKDKNNMLIYKRCIRLFRFNYCCRSASTIYPFPAGITM